MRLAVLDLLALNRRVVEQILPNLCLVGLELPLKLVGERAEFSGFKRVCEHFSLASVLRIDRKCGHYRHTCSKFEPNFHTNPLFSVDQFTSLCVWQRRLGVLTNDDDPNNWHQKLLKMSLRTTNALRP